MATLTLSNLADYYGNLLPYEYRSQPRAFATIRLVCSQLMNELLALGVQDGFNIETAVGAQLDVIGKYVGVSRQIGIPTPQPYFGFWDSTSTDVVTQNTNGFTSSTDSALNAQGVFFQGYFIGQQNTFLNDEAYRLVLKLQIVNNQSNSTLYEIQNYLSEFLPGLVSIVDNEDMTLTYTLTENVPIPAPVLEQFLPKPAGVGINFVFFDATPDTTSKTQIFHFSAPHTVTSGAITVTAANGTGPYTYQWQRLTESRPDFPDFPGTVANSPTSAATTFSHSFGGSGFPKTSVSTWICHVNDSSGLTASTDIITLTLTIDGPP